MARHRAAHESDEPTNESDVDDTPDSEDERSADEPDTDGTRSDDEDEQQTDEPKRTSAVAEFWSDLAVDPIEIALPSGVGYTLRAYRSPDEVTSVPGAEPEPAEDDASAAVAAEEKPGTGTVTAKAPPAADDEDEDDEPAGKRGRRKGRKAKKSAEPAEADDEEAAEDKASDDAASRTSDDEGETDRDAESDDDESDESESEESESEESESEESEDDDEDEDEDEEPAGPDEVPVFLSQRGKLLLFRTPEALAAFVRSDEPHSLRGVEQAESLADRIEATHVAPDDDDRYELDLLVKNLRGGHDTWEPDLVISAGELARDLAYALHLESVQTSLSPGSPLDDLDEAMRARANGGLGAFRARRRMRKIGAQQAALAWRTIIGKISAAVDWRD